MTVARAVGMAGALGAIAAALWLGAGVDLFGARGADPPRPRRLVIVADGVSWEAFDLGRQRGLFRRFENAGRHVAPYPSMSHPSWAEVFGTARVFGARGVLPSVEGRWFDLDRMRIVDDPREIIARQASPYSFQRAFDAYFDPMTEPLMFLDGVELPDRELAETERSILNDFTGSEFVAYIGGSDAMAHTHLNEFWPYLERLDAMIGRVADSLEARGTPADLWLVSDHGNAGGFVEGEREDYLTPVSLDRAIRRAGLSPVDTGSLILNDQVAVVTIALATMVNVYFADLSRRPALARSALAEEAVDLVTWLEVGAEDRYVVIAGRGGSEAHLRWRHGEYAYERIRGNPLQLPDSLGYSESVPRWIPDALMRAATERGPYPDAAYRLARSADKQVENAPDLIVNLRDGYCHAGDLGRAVRMVRTHGSLGARSTLGVLASSATKLPSHARSDEILGLIGLDARVMLDRVADLHPHDALALARSLGQGSRMIATRRDDEGIDASFVRRARPIVLSIGYFTFDALRELAAFLNPPAGERERRDRRVDATRSAFDRTDVIGGVSKNLDTLLSLVDSLDPEQIDDRLREAEEIFSRIPELAPLAGLRSTWSGDSRDGDGSSLRRAAMAAWTLQYFLDAALLAPETDSVPDLRDAAFARSWFSETRERVIRDPARLLSDTLLAPQLFGEVFAERKLARSIEPATLPSLYDRDVSGATLVYVPGIYGELFDDEIWSRGLRAARERLGMRTLSVPVDGRCASDINAGRIVEALHTDTRRRLERGYDRPTYIIFGYSKGGIDATEALLLDPELARAQVAALVTVATPHMGTPVAEHADIPTALLRWAIRSPPALACDTARSTLSLYPATRTAFWGEQREGGSIAGLTRLFSLSFVSDAVSAHPWMKLTKRIGRFEEPNDGVVPLSSSRFPSGAHAVHLGAIDADHIAGRLASHFPQEAFVESLVITLAELGVLEKESGTRWARAIAERSKKAPADSRLVSPFASALRAESGVGSPVTGWTPTRTFRTSEIARLDAEHVRERTRYSDPEGMTFRCDQADMTAFRREYEFYYDASNGGREHDPANGFALVAAADAANGRACQLASRATTMKMTTLAYRFRPTDFPTFTLRLKMLVDLSGVDATREKRGKNDASFKVWLALRDMRGEAKGRVTLLGYSWASVDTRGVAPPEGTLQEAHSSRRNVVVATLPEAWVVAIGGPAAMGRWSTIERDVATDLRRAFPAVPAESLQVVGITIQTDSDETRARTKVLLESLSFTTAR